MTPGAQEATNDDGVSKNKKKDKKNKKTPEDEGYDPVPKTGPNGEPIITRKSGFGGFLSHLDKSETFIGL